jgi:hypothetical protein
MSNVFIESDEGRGDYKAIQNHRVIARGDTQIEPGLFIVPTHGQHSPDLYLRITVARYELICWKLVSFLQCYLIVRVVVWLVTRKQPHIAIA